MAVRLSVIMIHSRAPTAGAQRMSEEIVGQLIGAEGIDLTLIGSLSGLAETSTDRLSLESLSGDVAVLDWQPPDAVVAGLDAAGFRGQRAPHPHDTMAQVPPSGIRRVYAFDLNRFPNAAELVGALRQLNARRQVRTFAIGLGAPSPVGLGTASRKVPVDNADQAVSPQAQVSETVAAAQAERLPTPSGEKQSRVADSETDKPLDLDDLLDQLDRADV